MLLGQSLFQSVLNRLNDEDAVTEPEPPVGHRISGLNLGFVSEADSRVALSAQAREQSYLDFGPEPPAPVVEEPPVMPAHLGRLTAAEIAEDLALTAQDTVHSLSEKRRLFAKNNHPDGVLADFRDNANARMMIANRLIDEAIRRLAS